MEPPATWIERWIKPIMVVTGLLTTTMIYPVFAPAAAFQSTFGQTLEGEAAKMVVRNWGALIAIVGGLLVYGAFRPAVRSAALVIASVSKLVFIGLVLGQGSLFLSHQAGIDVVADGIFVLLYAWYFMARRGARA